MYRAMERRDVGRVVLGAWEGGVEDGVDGG